VKEDEFLPVKQVDEAGLEALNSEIRRRILDYASGQKVTVEDIVGELDVGEQSAYYHLKQLVEQELLEVTEGKPKFFEAENSGYYFKPDFVESEENPLILENVPEILRGFVENRKIKSRIIVGAPYPHGEHDRRHKTGYKAGEISAVLGNYGRKRGQLIHTDTELGNNMKLMDKPLISVAGPLVNTFSAELNSKMPAKFTETNNEIITKENSYSGDETGLVARVEIGGKKRMLVAGLFGLGTSAAIYALANKAEQLGSNGAVVKGYGTKHNIEEVEILEKL
jgi:DNA-binding transcriptional ArsR family regulator